jgi:MtN3 and saliva related transmembrane protein
MVIQLVMQEMAIGCNDRMNKVTQSLSSEIIHFILHDRDCPPNQYYLARPIITMNSIQLLGLAAGALTTAAFLPQVIKTWRSRSAKDLSLGMFSLFCLGVLLWLIYGLIVKDIPVIAANLLTLMLASTLLYFKLHFKE